MWQKDHSLRNADLESNLENRFKNYLTLKEPMGLTTGSVRFLVHLAICFLSSGSQLWSWCNICEVRAKQKVEGMKAHFSQVYVGSVSCGAISVGKSTRNFTA